MNHSRATNSGIVSCRLCNYAFMNSIHVTAIGVGVWCVCGFGGGGGGGGGLGVTIFGELLKLNFVGFQIRRWHIHCDTSDGNFYLKLDKSSASVVQSCYNFAHKILQRVGRVSTRGDRIPRKQIRELAKRDEMPTRHTGRMRELNFFYGYIITESLILHIHIKVMCKEDFRLILCSYTTLISVQHPFDVFDR